jgi:hypothetical protein
MFSSTFSAIYYEGKAAIIEKLQEAAPAAAVRFERNDRDRRNPMRTSKTNILIVGATFLAACPCVFGLNPDGKEALEQKLKEQYTLTKLTADGTGVVTAGAVITLKKDGLILTPSTGTDVSGNSYKDGRITQSTVGKVNEKAKKIGGIFHKIPGMSAPDAPTNATRTFVAGEKLNVTKIEAKDGAVVFEVYSAQAYSDVYYRGMLSFPVEKGTVPAPDVMLATAGQVFKVDPPEDSKDTKEASQPAAGAAQQSVAPQSAATQPPVPQPTQSATPEQPAVKHYEDIAPPPPPDTAAPAQQPKLEMGETIDQVVAQLGQPSSTATDGDKQIYLYKDWKITFLKGKVADVDAR